MVQRIVDMHIRGWTNPLAGRALYSIPEIRTAINFIAEKTASVPFRHIRAMGTGEMLPLEDNIQRVLAVRPNPYNTPQAFVNVIVTRLLVNGYAYIYPEWEGKNLKGLYPLPFTSHSIEKDQSGRQWVVFPSDTGKLSFLLEDLIILNRFPALGEGKNLTTFTDPVSNYVNILGTIQGQAVDDAETSGRIAGLMETSVPLNEADMQKKLQEFKKAYLTSQNVTGLGMVPTGYKFIPIDFKKNPLNIELLNTITKQLYNYYGVSSEIINGNATELQYEQFVDNTVKPICYQFEEELTYKLFTSREISEGHRVQATMVDLEISTLQAKTFFLEKMLFAGVFNRNEARVWLGRGKGGPELDEHMISKNFGKVITAGETAPAEAPQIASPADGTTDIQQTALNGAQVDSLLTIISSVAAGQIPRATGVQLLMAAFQFTTEQAEAIMGEVGKGFEPSPAVEGGDDAGKDNAGTGKDPEDTGKTG